VLVYTCSYKRARGTELQLRQHFQAAAVRSFKRLDEFKYLGTNLKKQISIQKEIKSRLKPGNICCHSVQKLLSSNLLYKHMKIKIYKSIILPVVLYGCETWSLTLWEEPSLRVFRIGCGGEYLGLRGTK
jgi:hypothetical protein